MDEPFGALDASTRQSMQLFLLDLWDELKMTIFFVTHDLAEAVFLGTRILVLSQYYQHEAEGKRLSGQGARIVADYPLKTEQARSTRVKETAEFGRLIQKIRYDGFDPQYRQHATEFNLKHPDSFITFAE